jgi:hypothetical protein
MPFVRTFSVGVAVAASVGCTPEPGGVGVSDPSVQPRPPATNPPVVEHENPPKLPSWDEVKSTHPEGATNPPSPVLIVEPNGVCHKKWEGGMIPPGKDRVIEDCKTADSHCGTEVQCPERAEKILSDWKSGKGSGPTLK